MKHFSIASIAAVSLALAVGCAPVSDDAPSQATQEIVGGQTYDDNFAEAFGMVRIPGASGESYIGVVLRNNWVLASRVAIYQGRPQPAVTIVRMNAQAALIDRYVPNATNTVMLLHLAQPLTIWGRTSGYSRSLYTAPATFGNQDAWCWSYGGYGPTSQTLRSEWFPVSSSSATSLALSTTSTARFSYYDDGAPCFVGSTVAGLYSETVTTYVSAYGARFPSTTHRLTPSWTLAAWASSVMGS